MTFDLPPDDAPPPMPAIDVPMLDPVPPRRGRALMIQGTSSDVGKGLLVAGLARAHARRGLKVAPFKAQDMSNKAAVTADGGEIGRAQALQARAACVPRTVHLNPVLLKPETDVDAQAVVQPTAQIFPIWGRCRETTSPAAVHHAARALRTW